MYKLSKLPNNLTVLTQELKGIESATVLVLVGAGSRYENKQNNGIAHFLEHIFFKGGQKYKSSEEVARAIDAVGGEFNAFTGKEYAGYYVKVDARHITRAYDVLSDMLMSPSFSEEDLNRERGVILQEYEMYKDTPIYQVEWDFEKVLFGDQPLGWDQVGTPDFIQNVTKQEILDFREKLYTPENTVIAVSGKVNHEDVVASIKKYFPFLESKKSLEMKEFDSNLATEKITIHDKKTEQGHFVLGSFGYPRDHADRYAMSVLSALLGGSMSSRMFLEIREKLSLCYAVRTHADSYLDTGVFETYAGVMPSRIEEAITAVLAQYKKVTEEKVSEEELTKTKEFLKGKLTLSLEDSEQVAHTLARQQLLKGEIKTPEEIKTEIDKVTSDDLQRVAKELLKPEKMRLAIIGPFGGQEEKFENLLKF